MTDSEFGYVHLMNDDQVTIELGTWSAATLRNRRRRPDRGFAVQFVDLDRFKQVNDSPSVTWPATRC